MPDAPELQNAGKNARSFRVLRFGGVALSVSVYGYAGAVTLLWFLLWTSGDRWWLATLLLFGPRWVYALPLALFAPLAVIWRRIWLLPLGISSVIVFGPIMGLRLSWGPQVSPPDLRVLTFNIERYNVTEDVFAHLLDVVRPDLIAVQECAGVGEWHIPPGWNVERKGELLVASKFPILRVEVSYCRWPPRNNPDVDGLYCLVDTPQGQLGFCNVHLDTPRRGLRRVLSRTTILDLSDLDYVQARIEFRRMESQELSAWVQQFSAPVILAGDFNMPTDSRIYQDYWSNYKNAFDETGIGYGYTKQTVIHGFEYSSRIDHAIAGPEWQPQKAWIGPDLGSDHLPLVAEFVRKS